VDKIEREERHATLTGVTWRLRTGCGKLYVTINFNNEYTRIVEVFGQMGKAGGCAACHLSALTMTISNYLRVGGDIWHIIRDLKGIQCHQPFIHPENKKFEPERGEFVSCVDALGRVLEYEQKLLEKPSSL